MKTNGWCNVQAEWRERLSWVGTHSHYTPPFHLTSKTVDNARVYYIQFTYSQQYIHAGVQV